MLKACWLWLAILKKKYVELTRPKIESRDPIFTGTRARSQVSGTDLGLGDTGRDRWGHCPRGCGCLGQVSSQLPLEDVSWGSLRHGAGRRFHSGMERLTKEFFSSIVLPDLVLSLWRCFFRVLESLSSRLSISLVIPTSPFMILCMHYQENLLRLWPQKLIVLVGQYWHLDPPFTCAGKDICR